MSEVPSYQAPLYCNPVKVTSIFTTDISFCAYVGWTPLHEACNYGHVKVASLLLKHRADVNARGMDGDTPLHDAAINQHIEVSSSLLAHNLLPHSSLSRDHTPLSWDVPLMWDSLFSSPKTPPLLIFGTQLHSLVPTAVLEPGILRSYVYEICPLIIPAFLGCAFNAGNTNVHACVNERCASSPIFTQ